MLQTYPPAADYAIQRHKIPKGNLTIPDREISKHNIINQGKNKEHINRTMPFNFSA
jgi:hypothetical protein